MIFRSAGSSEALLREVADIVRATDADYEYALLSEYDINGDQGLDTDLDRAA